MCCIFIQTVSRITSSISTLGSGPKQNSSLKKIPGYAPGVKHLFSKQWRIQGGRPPPYWLIFLSKTALFFFRVKGIYFVVRICDE